MSAMSTGMQPARITSVNLRVFSLSPRSTRQNVESRISRAYCEASVIRIACPALRLTSSGGSWMHCLHAYEHWAHGGGVDGSPGERYGITESATSVATNVAFGWPRSAAHMSKRRRVIGGSMYTLPIRPKYMRKCFRRWASEGSAVASSSCRGAGGGAHVALETTWGATMSKPSRYKHWPKWSSVMIQRASRSHGALRACWHARRMGANTKSEGRAANRRWSTGEPRKRPLGPFCSAVCHAFKGAPKKSGADLGLYVKK
mmetsp:Transcript_12641/g.29158  ORF Transcript_12641/g.29158 Transcript_12641/m.29158 type:complete len:259 (+) Transcript_12641:565-1341(+)